jgi:hypothetical protein
VVVAVSTGCLEEGGERGLVQREVEGSYAKDDLSLGRHGVSLCSQPLILDLRHVTVRKRNSVCDIEFRFPLAESDYLPIARLQRPHDLAISPCTSATSLSIMTSQSSIPEWEVVVRRHSWVHVRHIEWVFFLCLYVFLSLCLDIAVHFFVLILLGLQAMYCLLITLI